MTVTKKFIKDVIKKLSIIIDEPDDIFALNMAYCGAKFDTKSLISKQWKEIHHDEHNTVWLERIIESGEKFIVFRIAFTNTGYLRYIYAYQLNPIGIPAQVKIELSVVPHKYIKNIKDELNNVFIESAPNTIQEELDRVVSNLISSDIPEDLEKNYRKFLLWAGAISCYQKTSTETAIRIIYGMLRFGNFCQYNDVLAKAAFSAIELQQRKAAACLASMALKNSDSKSCNTWTSLGCALERLGDFQTAFSCFANAWNLNKTTKIYSNNLWIEGERLIPLLLQDRRFDELLTVTKTLLNSVTEDIKVCSLADVLCSVGMVYEAKNDFEEAEKYYSMALKKMQPDKSPEATQNEDDESLYPLAWQSLWRLKTTPDEIREKYFAAQIKSYPKSPLEVGFDGRAQVKYVEGITHGSHWGTLLPNASELMTILPGMIKKSVTDAEGPEIPLAELGFCKFSESAGIIYHQDGEETTPVESMTILGLMHGKDKLELCTAFPKLKTGTLVEFEVIVVQEWMNGLEATAEVELNDEQRISFFIPDYYMDRKLIKANHNFMVELAGFCYEMNKFEPVTFNIDAGPLLEEHKERLRKEGKSDAIESVPVHMNEDTNNFCRQIFSDVDDDIEFIGKIKSVRPFKFLGNDCFEIVIKFNEERYKGIKLPIYIGAHKLDDYIPKVGDTVQGVLWLQGILRKDLGEAKRESTRLPEETTDSMIEKLFGTGVPELNLSAMAEGGLKCTSKASAITEWKNPVGNDPDLVCHINNKNHFIKVIHGYFDDEESFNTEVRKRSIPVKLLDKYPLEYVVIGGTKLGEGYKMHYLGFEELRLT
jgi:tetratricopeptide (TPR) repeat protein